jgi:carboxymethylenebutenolidase
MVSDVRQALAALSASGVGDKVGVTGFCFGGGMVLNSLAAGVEVKAAVPFYGPAPSAINGLATTKAAVSLVYAERDTRITGTKDAVEAQLKQSGKPYKVTVYPGVDHAFHNDTGARYNATQAEAAWIATIDWFRQQIV